MDVVLQVCDKHVFTPFVYPSWWSEGDIWRQFLTLNVVITLGGTLVYFIPASFNYCFIYDKRLLKHPQVLHKQVQKEIFYTLRSIPVMALFTNILFLLEIRGYSLLYNKISDSKYGWWMVVASVIAFLMFTDCLIYWIHRGLHHKLVYKHIHKPHHKWKIPTPFASHAFHPLDGFLQSVPYHLYVFLFPMNKYVYLVLYIAVNIWTVSIHDGNYKVPAVLKPVINGSAHHMDHHVFYNYNYGQYLTLWDRLGGSFRNPSSYEGNGPLEEVLKIKDT
ncbi:lathosterol oxidase-like [Limulus polyphemus]|uniref:Lathosterol oxidase-like n=1 Tax=Limulus polyphemus TaxID=6850 RepID=A0ABM1BVG4_LIMPO|nr:lathosterol oxidase-like [Limulus polyphemus]